MPLTVILDNAALTPREWRFCVNGNLHVALA